MGDAYYQGGNVSKADADNYGSNWTRDELIMLRDMWRRISLIDLAQRLGRTERACESMYYHQLTRPPEEGWEPADGERAATVEPASVGERDTRPVRTIHADEDRWWEPAFYTR